MKQFNPFPEVSARYGAPMGRRGDCAYIRASSRADALDKVRKGAV